MTNNTDADIRAEFERWSAGANCFTPELKLEMAFRYALALGIEQGKRIENEACADLCHKIEQEEWKAYKHGDDHRRADPHYQGISDGAGQCCNLIQARIKP